MDAAGRKEFETVYHSDGNKAITFLAAACQFNEAWCWPSSLFIASLSPRFSMSDSVSPSVFHPFLATFLLPLFLSLWSGMAATLQRHFSNEWVSELSFFFCNFFFNPNLLLPPPSRCSMHGEDTRDAFPCATRDVHNPFPVKQMSYIKLSLRKPR